MYNSMCLDISEHIYPHVCDPTVQSYSTILRAYLLFDSFTWQLTRVVPVRLLTSLQAADFLSAEGVPHCRIEELSGPQALQRRICWFCKNVSGVPCVWKCPTVISCSESWDVLRLQRYREDGAIPQAAQRPVNPVIWSSHPSSRQAYPPCWRNYQELGPEHQRHCAMAMAIPGRGLGVAGVSRCQTRNRPGWDGDYLSADETCAAGSLKGCLDVGALCGGWNYPQPQPWTFGVGRKSTCRQARW